MAVSNEVPESLFAYVVVVARRSRQLMSGGRPLLDNPKSHKNTRVAQEELAKGLLEYETPNIPGEGEDKEGKRRKG